MIPSFRPLGMRNGQRLAIAVLALGGLFSATSAHAATNVYQELFLSMDVSGSVTDSQYDTYRNGYVTAFNLPSVKSHIQSTFANGGVAIAVGQWTTTEFTPLAIGWTLVNSDAAYSAFVSALSGMPRQGTGSTCTGCGMKHAIDEITSNGYETPVGIPNRKVIDVSTDGATNVFTVSAPAERDRAESLGIIINGLGIGSAATTTLTNDVVTDATSLAKAGFVEVADTDADFQAAIATKLVKEAGKTSVPGPLPIFAVAAGFSYSRRLRNRVRLALPVA